MQQNPYEATFNPQPAALAQEWERTTFIRRTYSHLAGAIGLFVFLEFLIFTAVPEATLNNTVAWATSGWNWMIVLGAFMAVSWIADSWASSTTSLSTQYIGLGVFVVAEAVIFVPLLFVASHFHEGAISAAALMTAIMFTALTLMVFTTRADFSWLGRYLWIAGFGALGLIACAIFLQFNLGVLFAGAMIVLASGYILYSTSNVLHHYRTDQYVAASLALFAAVALLFWYVLRIVMAFGRD